MAAMATSTRSAAKTWPGGDQNLPEEAREGTQSASAKPPATRAMPRVFSQVIVLT